MNFIFSVSTGLFSSYVMRKLRYFQYLYYDYFIAIPFTQQIEVNKWRENDRIILT